MTMTARERWLRLLNRESYDRVPLSYRATPEFNQKLTAHLGCDMQAALQRMHIDPLVTVGPEYAGPPLDCDADAFGIKYQETQYAGGSYHDPVFNPLAQYASVEEIEANYRWPDPDWWDYSGIPAQIEGKEDCVIRGGSYEEFAKYKDLRGVTQAYMDIALQPDMVHYCMEKLTELRYQDAARIYEQIPGKVIWTWVAEDFGTQEGLLISLDSIREFFLPHMQRMVTLAHEAGAYAFHHSDGAVRANLPNMIGIGIDVLEPVQWRAKGMNREGLKRDFGDNLVFMGGMDNQQTLVTGTEAEIRQEVRDNIDILGAGGARWLPQYTSSQRSR